MYILEDKKMRSYYLRIFSDIPGKVFAMLFETRHLFHPGNETRLKTLTVSFALQKYTLFIQISIFYELSIQIPVNSLLKYPKLGIR